MEHFCTSESPAKVLEVDVQGILSIFQLVLISVGTCWDIVTTTLGFTNFEAVAEVSDRRLFGQLQRQDRPRTSQEMSINKEFVDLIIEDFSERSSWAGTQIAA